MTEKERALETIKKMPDDITVEDIMERLYIQESLRQGVADMDAGRAVSHEEVKKRIESWRTRSSDRTARRAS